ncbi:MAG: S8 family serine peptidase [Lachnospiraceae bacterium]|nr:S8 family serine peptidase [Lachnospiraceae bacterium]
MITNDAEGADMPESEKIENLLSLSLDATSEELRSSPNLSAGIVGAEQEEPVWEVIVKYNGSIAGLAGENIIVEELIAGYGIITLPESYIPLLAEVEQIEYIEKPKLLYPGDLDANFSSCIVEVTRNDPYLTGQGVLVAVIDSGIDYYNDAFRNADGTTRIAYLYDQSLGTEFSSEQIDEALRAGSRQEAYAIVPSRDVTGHGTAVCSIAAGRTYGAEDRRADGVATGSRLLIVKLDTRGQGSFPMTTNLMRAFTYVVKKAQEMGMPVAINLSFGNTYGSHNGTSLVERFLDNVSEIGRCVVCVGSGNEGAAGGHASGNLSSGEEMRIEFAVGEYESNLNLQLWKSYTDLFSVRLVHPSGSERVIDTAVEGTTRYVLDEEEVLVYVGFPKPYVVLEEIYINHMPQGR